MSAPALRVIEAARELVAHVRGDDAFGVLNGPGLREALMDDVDVLEVALTAYDRARAALAARAPLRGPSGDSPATLTCSDDLED